MTHPSDNTEPNLEHAASRARADSEARRGQQTADESLGRAKKIRLVVLHDQPPQNGIVRALAVHRVSMFAGGQRIVADGSELFDPRVKTTLAAGAEKRAKEVQSVEGQNIETDKTIDADDEAARNALLADPSAPVDRVIKVAQLDAIESAWAIDSLEESALWREIVSLAEARRIDAIYFWEIARLFRNMDVYFEAFSVLKKYNVKLISIKDEFTRKLNTPGMEGILAQVMMVFGVGQAQGASDDTSARVGRQAKQQKAKGIGGHASRRPVGWASFRMDLLLDEYHPMVACGEWWDEAAAVREIITRLGNGEYPYQIARDFNQRGHLYRYRPKDDPRPWTAAIVLQAAGVGRGGLSHRAIAAVRTDEGQLIFNATLQDACATNGQSIRPIRPILPIQLDDQGRPLANDPNWLIWQKFESSRKDAQTFAKTKPGRSSRFWLTGFVFDALGHPMYMAGEGNLRTRSAPGVTSYGAQFPYELLERECAERFIAATEAGLLERIATVRAATHGPARAEKAQRLDEYRLDLAEAERAEAELRRAGNRVAMQAERRRVRNIVEDIARVEAELAHLDRTYGGGGIDPALTIKIRRAWAESTSQWKASHFGMAVDRVVIMPGFKNQAQADRIHIVWKGDSSPTADAGSLLAMYTPTTRAPGLVTLTEAAETLGMAINAVVYQLRKHRIKPTAYLHSGARPMHLYDEIAIQALPCAGQVAYTDANRPTDLLTVTELAEHLSYSLRRVHDVIKASGVASSGVIASSGAGARPALYRLAEVAPLLRSRKAGAIDTAS